MEVSEQTEGTVSRSEFLALQRELVDLKALLGTHRHNGRDGSIQINGEIRLDPMTLLKHGKVNHLDVTTNPGTAQEQVAYLLTVGNDVGENLGDTTNNAQVNLVHQPATDGSTNQSFLYAFRPPLWQGSGIVIASGTAVFTDAKRNWEIDSLAGAHVNVYKADNSTFETHLILSNTANSITVDSNFAFSDNAGVYVVFMPVYHGSADFPWRQGYYMGQDVSAGLTGAQRRVLRFGFGPTAGAGVVGIYIGTGSPETVVSAYPGSVYLRTNGGASTTFYIKESGAGTNTGWIAK